METTRSEGLTRLSDVVMLNYSYSLLPYCCFFYSRPNCQIYSGKEDIWQIHFTWDHPSFKLSLGFDLNFCKFDVDCFKFAKAKCCCSAHPTISIAKCFSCRWLASVAWSHWFINRVESSALSSFALFWAGPSKAFRQTLPPRVDCNCVCPICLHFSVVSVFPEFVTALQSGTNQDWRLLGSPGRDPWSP